MKQTDKEQAAEEQQIGPLSQRPPTEIQGPRRRAPMYYAGETYGRRRLNYPDVERLPSGRIPGIRNKAARRVIRAAFGRHVSKVERGLRFARDLRGQAQGIVSEHPAIEDRNGRRAWKGKSARAGRRLFAQELAIHQTVYAPDKKTLRAMRTQKRRAARRGVKDAIAQLVERMATK